jgi:hypothetical protein
MVAGALIQLRLPHIAALSCDVCLLQRFTLQDSPEDAGHPEKHRVLQTGDYPAPGEIPASGQTRYDVLLYIKSHGNAPGWMVLLCFRGVSCIACIMHQKV